MPNRLSDLEIKMSVVSTMSRWPAIETVAFTALKDCVDQMRALVFGVDQACTAAEMDRDLSLEGIARKRISFGKDALSQLADYKPLKQAEAAVARNIASMEERMQDMPKPPSTIAEVMLAAEIRAHISKKTETAAHSFVIAHMSDPRVVSAVLHAPAFLSGLGDASLNMVRERARQALHPQQVEIQQALTKALQEVREGVTKAKRLLLERCELREDEDGEVRHIKEPQPKINLTAKAREAKAATAS